uniref:Uncharacterized protein n=1 Tax=Laksystermes virus TaxID=2796606 RepID=A0A7T7GV14_9VIRU|nr:hypothetical protein 3 [Laksystermes virus]
MNTSDNDKQEESRAPVITETEPASDSPQTVHATLTSTGTDLNIEGLTTGESSKGITPMSLLNRWNIMSIHKVNIGDSNTVICKYDFPGMVLSTDISTSDDQIFYESVTQPNEMFFNLGMPLKATPSTWAQPSQKTLPTWSWAFNTATLYNGSPQLRFTFIGPPSISHQLEIRFQPFFGWDGHNSKFSENAIDAQQVQTFIEWQLKDQGSIIVDVPYYGVSGARPTQSNVGVPNIRIARAATTSPYLLVAGDSYVQSNHHRGMFSWGSILLIQRTPYYRPNYLPNAYFVMVEANWGGCKFFQPRAPPGITSVADNVSRNVFGENEVYANSAQGSLGWMYNMSYPEAPIAYAATATRETTTSS